MTFLDSLVTLRHSLALALRNLALHKLRSALTVTGLVFGVASVIAMLAVAEGASEEAQRQLADLGARNIILRSNKPVEDAQERTTNEERDAVPEYGLTYADLRRVEGTLPSVVAVTPLREFPQEVRYHERALEGRVVGATPAYLAMNGLHLAEGRFLAPIDLDRMRNVCVLGAELAEKLFPFESPVSKSLRVGDNHYYRIVGTTRSKTPSAGVGSSLSAQDFNRDVYIPLTTDRARFGETIMYNKSGTFSWERIELTQITVECQNVDAVRPTAASLTCLLEPHHPKRDFAIVLPLDLLEQAERTKRLFNIVLGSIAGISLLVGGIGIMNIMLATVTERTREIGVRRALGAKRSDITRQFLIETATLSTVGGLLGVVLGLAAGPAIAQLSGMVTRNVVWAPAVAFLVAVLAGVGFGLYPARRAARMDPEEALRAE